MKFFQKKKFKDIDFVNHASMNSFIAPANNGKPAQEKIISHGWNSHTLKPKFVTDPPIYGDEFCGLDSIHSVDYPGMFESRGPELDIALYLGI